MFQNFTHFTKSPNLPAQADFTIAAVWKENSQRVYEQVKTKSSVNQRRLTLLKNPLAVRTRLELATPCVTGMYSNQLNYPTIWIILEDKFQDLKELCKRS